MRYTSTGRRQGCILWLTGLSGAGKTTLARALGAIIRPQTPVELLDGDEIRAHLSADLGFSKQDRDAHVRRIGFVARLLARNGVIAIAAAVSPYADARNDVRRAAEGDEVPFVEIHVMAELSTLISRDPKGLYRKALLGEITNFTGISDPYEVPNAPEVTICTDRMAIDTSTDAIVTYLRNRGLLPVARAAGDDA